METKCIKIAPGFSIREDGVTYDPFGDVRPTYRNLDEYKTTSVRRADGTWRTFGVHVLVANEFVENDKPGLRNRVNHFDTDKDNNHMSNLEWVTDRENAIHRDLYLGKYKRPRVVLRHINLGGVVVSDLHEGAELISLTPREIWELIKNGGNKNGWTATYLSRKDKIPADLKKPTVAVRDAMGKNPSVRIRIKDLTTGLEKSYETILAGAKDIDALPSAVRQAISKNGKVKSLKGRYIVVLDDDAFPDVRIEDLGKYSRNLRQSMVGYHHVEKKLYIFSCVAQFLLVTGVSKKATWNRLNSKSLKPVGDWSVVLQTGITADVFKMLREHFDLTPEKELCSDGLS